MLGQGVFVFIAEGSGKFTAVCDSEAIAETQRSHKYQKFQKESEEKPTREICR